MPGDKRKNPWGNHGNDDKGRQNWGGNNKGGNEPPDMDDVLRKAQEGFRDFFPRNFQGGSIILLIILVIAGLWAFSGFYVVNPGENAVIQRFGQWNRTQANPGWGYHLPAPIESRTILNVEEIQKMNIGFIERYTRTGSKSIQDIPEESLMLTADRNIVDLDMVIQWNIKSGEDFLFNIFDQENTIKKVAESAIREVVGQTSMFRIITTDRTDIAQRTRDIIQENLDIYQSGVNITQVLIEDAQVHPEVQGAFQDVQSANQDAEDIKNRAEAYKEDIIPRARGAAIQMLQQAEGYKQSTVARANGDADRFKSVYEAYLSGKDVTKERIYIETMENVLQNASKIIMDNNGGEQGIVPYLPLNELKKTGQ